jgi:hypothetical protein
LCKNDDPISWNGFQTFQTNNTHKIFPKEDFAIIQILVHLYEKVGKKYIISTKFNVNEKKSIQLIFITTEYINWSN